MFDMSWGEVMVIGAVALIVIGPKDLPKALRTVGSMTAKVRRMAAEFQGQFNEAMREAEMADLKKTFDETTSSLNSALDPSGFKTDMEKLIQDPAQLDSSAATSMPATPPSDPAAPVAQPATSTPEATPPTDPVALGTAPVAPVTAAPLPDVSVPMPELPPAPQNKDFADATPAPSPPAPASAPDGSKPA